MNPTTPTQLVPAESKQSRLKSKVLWLTLLSAIVAFMFNSGIIDLHLSQVILNIINTLLTLLAAFGIINNPTDPQNI